MNLVRPAIGYIASANAMAILKRAMFNLFAKDHVYYPPPPSEKERNVKRIRWPRGDLFADPCKHIISNMKANGPVPSNYDDKTEWEEEWHHCHSCAQIGMLHIPVKQKVIERYWIHAAVGDCPDEPDQAHFQEILPEDSMPHGYSELSDADAAACCIGGAAFKEACLITSLQNLGLPVSCSPHGPFPILVWQPIASTT